MDYRDTEDFARRMEAAELRAQLLRRQAIDAWLAAAARIVRRAAHRIAHPRRADKLLPGA
jgi:hypothetical protein